MLVGVELRPQFDVGMDSFRGGLQVSFFHRSKERASATFPHSKHGSFTNRPASGAELLVLMLVRFLATDKTLVKLYHAFQFLHDGGSRTRLTQAVKDEPRGLLRDADLLRQLQRRDSLAGSHQQVHGVEPLVQRNLATLKDGASANGEVKIAASVAAVEPNPLARRNPFTALAVRTDHAVRPEARFQIEPSGFLVREGLKQLESADSAFAHLAHLLLLLRGVATLIEDGAVLFFREAVRVAFLARDRFLNAVVVWVLRSDRFWCWHVRHGALSVNRSWWFRYSERFAHGLHGGRCGQYLRLFAVKIFQFARECRIVSNDVKNIVVEILHSVCHRLAQWQHDGEYARTAIVWLKFDLSDGNLEVFHNRLHARNIHESLTGVKNYIRHQMKELGTHVYNSRKFPSDFREFPSDSFASIRTRVRLRHERRF